MRLHEMVANDFSFIGGAAAGLEYGARDPAQGFVIDQHRVVSSFQETAPGAGAGLRSTRRRSGQETAAERQCAAAQSSPTPASTTSGTFSSSAGRAAPSIVALITSIVLST